MKVLSWRGGLLTNSGVKPRRGRICGQRRSINPREGFLAEGTVKTFVNRIERPSNPLCWNVLSLKWDVQNSVWVCGWKMFYDGWFWWFLYDSLTLRMFQLFFILWLSTRPFFALKTICLYNRLTQKYDVSPILSSWQSSCQSTSLNSIAVTNEVRVI